MPKESLIPNTRRPWWLSGFTLYLGTRTLGAEQEGLDPQSWITSRKSSELSLLEQASSQRPPMSMIQTTWS